MANKIKLKDKSSGVVIEVTQAAYNMRKNKYAATHTIVKDDPAKLAPSPKTAVQAPAPASNPSLEEAAEEENDAESSTENTAENQSKKGPGRPKKQAE